MKRVLPALVGVAVLVAIVASALVALDKWAGVPLDFSIGEYGGTAGEEICGKDHHGEIRHLPDGTIQVCRK